MSPLLKLILFLILIAAVIDLISVIKRLVPMAKRVREINRLKKDLDVISVEAEIVEIHTERIDDLDTMYKIKMYYEVGWRKFYKDFMVVNNQSARVGQKVTLLCDSSDPENATLQSGVEGSRLKSTIFNLIICILVIIIDTALNAADVIIG